jgi:hypothetical protein
MPQLRNLQKAEYRAINQLRNFREEIIVFCLLGQQQQGIPLSAVNGRSVLTLLEGGHEPFSIETRAKILIHIQVCSYPLVASSANAYRTFNWMAIVASVTRKLYDANLTGFTLISVDADLSRSSQRLRRTLSRRWGLVLVIALHVPLPNIRFFQR